MTIDDFKSLLDNRFTACRNQLLGSKNVEYTRNNDKLHNFKVAAGITRVTPEHALLGMWSKHLVSLIDIVYDLDEGRLPTDVILSEKIGDTINYAVLLEALIIERKGKSNIAEKYVALNRVSADDNDTKECIY